MDLDAYTGLMPIRSIGPDCCRFDSELLWDMLWFDFNFEGFMGFDCYFKHEFDFSIFDLIWDPIYSPRGNIIGMMILMNEIVMKISTA